jgi:hypothetical protein
MLRSAAEFICTYVESWATAWNAADDGSSAAASSDE